MQAAIFGPIFLILLAFPDLVGEGLLSDPSLGGPIRAASFVVIAYAFYAVLVGVLNGTKRFAVQASLDMTFATMKTFGVVLVVAFTGSVTLSFLAFSLAAMVILAIAAIVTPRQGNGGTSSLSWQRYLSFLFPLGAYAFLLNVLLQADVIGVKMAMGYGQRDLASEAAGVFGAAKNVAMIPYQVVISLTLAIFPFVSRASSMKDEESSGAAVSLAMRATAIMSMASVVLIVPCARDLLDLLFGEGYGDASNVMLPLLLALALLAFMYVGNAVLASAGEPKTSFISTLGAVVVQVGLLVALLPEDSLSHSWTQAAVATLSGCLLGAVVTAWRLKRRFPRARWFRTFLGALFAVAIGLGFDRIILESLPLPWALRPFVAFLIYGALLLATRAVGSGDLALLLEVLRRRSSSGRETKGVS